MKKFILIIFCSVNSVFLTAQKKEFLQTPKFNEADLSKQKSLIDENAPAEIIYRSCYFRIDTEKNRMYKTYVYRVKIYDKDKAEDWLNLEIPLYKGGSDEEILLKLKAATYNLENGKAVSTAVDKSSKYKSKESKNITINKFAFPNVKNGSILDYEYQVESPYYFSIPEVLIETSTPSVYTEYVLDSPINISFNLNYTGSLNAKYRSIEEKYIYGSNHKTYRFGYENLKGFTSEKFVRNDRNYRTKINAEVNSTNFGVLKLYSSSWEQIKDRLYENEFFGGELKKSKLAKELIPASISTLKNDIEKANAIFKYVQKQFKWNNEFGIYSDEGFKNLVKTKTGNAAEINLFLVAMMREANIKADPVLISTVNNGLINLGSPNVSNMNFVIVAIKTTDGYHLYDAASKQSSMDELPPRDWNSFGILVNKEKVQQLDMNNSKPSFTHLTVEAEINEDGTVSGKYFDRDTGTFAMLAKDNFDDNADLYKKQYKDNFALNFENIDSKVIDNGDFESTMSFASENLVDKIGKKIIINPLLFLNKNSNEFDQSEIRKFNIDFISPYTKIKKATIKIPEGYDIENLPKEKKIVTDDKEIEYSYLVVKKDRILEIISSTTVKSSEYPKEYFPAFKQIWNVASKSENQVISLIKK